MKRAWMLMMGVMAVLLAAGQAHAEKWMVTGDGDDILGNIEGHYFVPCLGERVNLKEYPDLVFRDARDQHCPPSTIGVDSARPDVGVDDDARNAEAGQALPAPDPLEKANRHIDRVLAKYRKEHDTANDDNAPDR